MAAAVTSRLSSLGVLVDADGVATITLDRPEIHNAFDDVMVAELTQALRRLDGDAQVRVVILAASGKSFSSGANLNWMKRMAGYSEAQNVKDALALAELMHTLHSLSKPTIARVHGAAYAGGLGLVACCDIAVATREASFCVSEVRLGLIPAVIMPYLIAAIGERQARRYCLTAETFAAAEAFRIGLIHQLVETHELQPTLGALVNRLVVGGPLAIAHCKAWIGEVAARPIDETLVAESARRIAALRASGEGREGVAAFLEKRDAKWIAAAKRRVDAHHGGAGGGASAAGKSATTTRSPEKASRGSRTDPASAGGDTVPAGMPVARAPRGPRA